MSLKIGITGSTGVLGSDLKKQIKKNISVFKGDIAKKNDVYDWIKSNKFKGANKIEKLGFFIGLPTKKIDQNTLNKLCNHLLNINNL